EVERKLQEYREEMEDLKVLVEKMKKVEALQPLVSELELNREGGIVRLARYTGTPQTFLKLVLPYLQRYKEEIPIPVTPVELEFYREANNYFQQKGEEPPFNLDSLGEREFNRFKHQGIKGSRHPSQIEEPLQILIPSNLVNLFSLVKEK
ncbi:MAG: hypothetical protein ABGW77_00710, partial [Campylobacterales bacterium]